SFICGY
ncbi:cys/Met metabolism PLP-dependent enzyme family protein, partial [Vibrio parahaemolyticus V-223/04]